MARTRLLLAIGGALLGAFVWAACGSSGGGDCTPTAEICNGVDDNCNGQTDEGFGVGTECAAGVGACQRIGALRCTPEGGAACDAVPGTPAVESCNQLDDDCDGQTDEDVAGCCHPGDEQACGVSQGACAVGVETCSASGAWGPCLADGSPVVLPGERTETCDGVDDDCDGQTDEGFGVGTSCAAGTGACLRAGSLQCVSESAVACDAVPGEPAVEDCNGVDDDCDGQTDEDLTPPPCAYQSGVCAGSREVCGGAAGWLACGAAEYGAGYEPTETSCDGLDNDCDGQTDEGVLQTLYPDHDQDGYGAGGGQQRCPGAGWIDTTGDCNDANADIHPGAVERCGNVMDDDCDGQTDEPGCI